MYIQQILAQLALKIAEHGTAPHRDALAAIADAVRELHPGTAAALTDWDGTEIARVRAFAIAHQMLLEATPADMQAAATRIGDEAEVALAA